MEKKNPPPRVVTHSTKRKQQFEKVYAEALELIRRFEVREFIPVIKLKEAGDKLIEAINIDETRIEPYVLLAEIFFNLDKKELAFKYLKIAREIDPNNPVINVLKDRILKHYLEI